MASYKLRISKLIAPPRLITLVFEFNLLNKLSLASPLRFPLTFSYNTLTCDVSLNLFSFLSQSFAALSSALMAASLQHLLIHRQILLAKTD